MYPTAPVYLALLHYPIRDKQDNEITTAVTNLDVHDGGRLAATYGLSKYFIVTPLDEQQALVNRICSHWVSGPGGKKTPTRRIAMETVCPGPSLQWAVDQITEAHGQAPILVGTSAQKGTTEEVSYQALREELHEQETPILLVFGTGWGIADSVQPKLDKFLPPICGPTNYNHLSVRAAMAITLDRLLNQPTKRTS